MAISAEKKQAAKERKRVEKSIIRMVVWRRENGMSDHEIFDDLKDRKVSMAAIRRAIQTRPDLIRNSASLRFGVKAFEMKQKGSTPEEIAAALGISMSSVFRALEFGKAIHKRRNPEPLFPPVTQGAPSPLCNSGA